MGNKLKFSGNMSKKIAVILSGCGVYDGAEIHEATLTMLAISQQGGEYSIFAPNVNQAHVVNHLTGEEMNESRNVLVESARIARGNINALSDFDANDFDALVFPGGFGAAKNLSTFAFNGVNLVVNGEVEKAIKDMLAANKPIGALCISPVILAKLIPGIELTIGQDEGTAQAVNELGGKHVQTTHGQVIIDTEHKVVTTPCYMLDANISQIADGANNVVKSVLGMLN